MGKRTEKQKAVRSLWYWFQEFFDDHTSGASTTRALNWIWTGTLCFSILLIVGVEAYLAIKKGDASVLKLPDVASAYIMLTGAYLAAKVGQRIWGEQTESVNIPAGIITTTINNPLPTSGSSSGYIPPG